LLNHAGEAANLAFDAIEALDDSFFGVFLHS
jgi:hypothetical protein